MASAAIPLHATLHARLEATREVLLNFEASVVRLPADLRTAVRMQRRITEETQTRLAAAIAALPSDPDKNRQQELVYVNFVRTISHRAQQLTTATGDADLPHDLIALMRRHVTIPEDLPLILRATSHPTFECETWNNPIELLEDAWVPQTPSGPSEPFDVPWRPRILGFIEVPVTFARATFLQLLALGHELAHVQDDFADQQEPLYNGYVSRALETVARPPEVAAITLENWANELFADLVAARRYGPAAALALADFSQLVGAFGEYTETHPPSELRLSVMLTELQPFLETPPAGRLSTAAFTVLRSYARDDATLVAQADAEYSAVVRTILDAVPALAVAAAELEPSAYAPRTPDRIESLASDFAAGVARSDHVIDPTLTTQPEVIADLFLAAAVVRHSTGIRELAAAMTAKATPDPIEIAQAVAKLDDLLAHALAGVHLTEEWRAQQPKPASLEGAPRSAHARARSAPASAILSTRQIRERLASGEREAPIVVTPLIDPNVSPGTLDVRLGREFIAFRKTRYLGVDPIATLREAANNVKREEEELAKQRADRGLPPRALTGVTPELLEHRSQDELRISIGRTVERIFVPFGETFVLHPN